MSFSADLTDPHWNGFQELNVNDETIMSTLEGTAEELSLLDYGSLSDLSPDVIHKMHTVVETVCGTVGKALTRRYSELWKEE